MVSLTIFMGIFIIPFITGWALSSAKNYVYSQVIDPITGEEYEMVLEC